MKTYSLLFINDDETIEASKRLAFESDEQAMDVAAAEAKHCHAVQIWEGDRSVGIIQVARTTPLTARHA